MTKKKLPLGLQTRNSHLLIVDNLKGNHIFLGIEERELRKEIISQNCISQHVYLLVSFVQHVVVHILLFIAYLKRFNQSWSINIPS